MSSRKWAQVQSDRSKDGFIVLQRSCCLLEHSWADTGANPSFHKYPSASFLLLTFLPLLMILIIIKLPHKYLRNWTNGIIYWLSKYLLSAASQHTQNSPPNMYTCPHICTPRQTYSHPCSSMFVHTHSHLMHTYIHTGYKEGYVLYILGSSYISYTVWWSKTQGVSPGSTGRRRTSSFPWCWFPQFSALAAGILASQQLLLLPLTDRPGPSGEALSQNLWLWIPETILQTPGS